MVPKSEKTSVEFRGVETVSRASIQEFAITCEVFIVASM